MGQKESPLNRRWNSTSVKVTPERFSTVDVELDVIFVEAVHLLNWCCLCSFCFFSGRLPSCQRNEVGGGYSIYFIVIPLVFVA